MANKKEFKKRPVPAAVALTVASVAALFSLALSILLIADHVQLAQRDPLNDPVLLQLREQLAESAVRDEALLEQIRTVDFYARRAFFHNQKQRRTGGWLLLGGAAVCFAALTLFQFWNPRLPSVEKRTPSDPWELNSLFRNLMAGTGLFLLATALALAFAVQSDLTAVMQEKAEQPEPPASAAEPAPRPFIRPSLQTNWPSFRGPGGFGIAWFTNAPIHWDIETGDGVLWKTEIPVHGFNSPIVWDDRVFLSGADEEGLEVFCFDANSGALLWTRTVETSVEFPEVSEDTGYAAPTMATDGQRVFAVFSTGELAAFDFDGNPVWQKNLGLPKNPYGMGSSLLSDGERLFVQYDHQHEQKIIALDSATGTPVWQMPRQHISWSSPALIHTGFGPQLILNDEQNVTAYDPVSGRQLWQVKCLGGEVAPSPAFNGTDLVFAANEYAQASALKLTAGTPEILWQYDGYLPEIASPVATADLLFLATSAGDFVCLDAATGGVLWEQEFDDGFNSSPILVGNRIYLIDLSGTVHIFEAAAKYKHLATVQTGEPVYATPAFLDGRIYIRGEDHLYCIGQKETLP